jgi:glycosyltransferase
MKVSLITATYQCGATVGECLASVAQQTHGDIEHIVIDGASTDQTLPILLQQRSAMAALVSEPDHGIYDALNKGLKLCTGEIIGVLHGDDTLADARVLERVAKAFADPAVVACYGDLIYVAKNDPTQLVRYWRAGEYSESRLRRGWMPPHPTFYARRSIYQSLGVFDLNLRIAADYNAMLTILLARAGTVAYLPEVLVRMRLGGVSNRSLANMLRKSREDLWVIRRHGIGGIGTLLCKNISKVGQFIFRPPNQKQRS